MHALIEDGNIIEVADLRKKFPKISFKNDLPDQYRRWFRVHYPAPESGKVIIYQSVELDNGIPTMIYVYGD